MHIIVHFFFTSTVFMCDFFPWQNRFVNIRTCTRTCVCVCGFFSGCAWCDSHFMMIRTKSGLPFLPSGSFHEDYRIKWWARFSADEAMLFGSI